MSKLCGTFSYIAPELYYGKTYTDKCDIYSIGIILWEIAVRIFKGFLFIYLFFIIFLLKENMKYLIVNILN